MEVHTPSGNWRLGLALALLASVMWGTLAIALKILLEQMDAFTITWYRFLTAAAVLGAYLTARGKLPNLRRLTFSMRGMLALAVFGLAGNYVLFILGLGHLSAGTAQVLIQLAPALATVGALVLFKERFGRVQWWGFFTVGAGMALFFQNRLGEIFSRLGSLSAGMLLIVASALSWAVYALAQKQLLKTMSSSSVLLVVYASSALILLPTADPAAVCRLNGLNLSLLAFCALNTLVAYGAFSEALAHWEASRVNATTALTPVLTFLAVGLGSGLWPGRIPAEGLTPLTCAGALLVVAGSMSIALGNGRARSTGNRSAGRT